jgi:protein TonB
MDLRAVMQGEDEMSSVAFRDRAPLPIHSHARKNIAIAMRPWSEVSIANGRQDAVPRTVFAGLLPVAALALIAHGAFAYYFTHAGSATKAPAPKHHVDIELVRPPTPPPPPPKMEPLKPRPQAPKARPVQVVPQIQTATPDPAPSDNAASAEPPIAVAPTVSAPVEAPPEKVTPPIGRAGYLNNPPPEYPTVAARQGWQGTVLLRVHVLENGQVDTVEVERTSGRRILDDQAMRTVKAWLFTPSKRGDTPIAGYATVPIEFSLDS